MKDSTNKSYSEDQMVRVPFHKLVRSKMPAELDRNGYSGHFRTMQRDEFFIALKTKLVEEAMEYSQNPCDEELADVLTVVNKLLEFHGHDNVGIAYSKKLDQRGDLEGLFLVDVDVPMWIRQFDPERASEILSQPVKKCHSCMAYRPADGVCTGYSAAYGKRLFVDPHHSCSSWSLIGADAVGRETEASLPVEPEVTDGQD